ncbi:MAG: hypothetical protein U0169_15470 [Polyangiaceae bacterium]
MSEPHAARDGTAARSKAIDAATVLREFVIMGSDSEEVDEGTTVVPSSP